MQLRDPDSTRPSAAEAPEEITVPLPYPAAGPPPCAIVALSDDPLLLEALAGAAFEGGSVSSSPSSDRFIDQLVANGAGIALIDAASVNTPLKSFLATLREQFPQLLLLLTGPAQLQAQFSAQLADGSLFRFVHKPASSQRLRLFIDAATRQLAAPVAGAAPQAARTARAASHPPAVKSTGGGPSGLLIAGLSVALLVAGIGGWAIWQHTSEPSPATSEPTATGQAGTPTANPTAEPVQPPPSATQPQEQPDSAAREAAAREAAAREAAAREAAALEQAQRSAQGARADQLAVYLQLARKRLASGALIEPADDSARTYLDSALALAPDEPEVRATSLALGEALITQFRRAVTAGDAAAAQRWLAACSNFHVGSTTLNQLTAQLQQLQAAQQGPGEPGGAAASSAQTGSAGTTAGAPSGSTPLAPPPAATAAAAAAPAGAAEVPTVVNEGSLTRVLFFPPSYPEDANARGIGGWVDLEFTVLPNGKVADITIVASEPADVFEHAARTALARNRYVPVLRDGVPVAQRARMHVRFKQ
jgi:periplasmic protein TonB